MNNNNNKYLNKAAYLMNLTNEPGNILKQDPNGNFRNSIPRH